MEKHSNYKSIHFDEFIDLPMSNIKAYLLGLLIPKIVISKQKNSNNYFLLGQINHGHQNKPSENDIMDHFLGLENFFSKNNLNVTLLINKDLTSFSLKKSTFLNITRIGFAVSLNLNNSTKLIFNPKSINNESYDAIRTLLLNEAKKITKDEAAYFVAATIDGRSSIDTTMKCISLDIDSNSNLNDRLRYLTINLMNMDINLNDRSGRSDATRMNQLRYKELSVRNFYKKYNDIIFSKFKRKKIEEVIL